MAVGVNYDERPGAGPVRPQVPDPWGRSPGHPDYGRPPNQAAPPSGPPANTPPSAPPSTYAPPRDTTMADVVGSPQSQPGGMSARDRAREQIRGAYQRYLNRSPSDAEIDSHLGGVYSDSAIQRGISTIRTSSEAQSSRDPWGRAYGDPAYGQGDLRNGQPVLPNQPADGATADRAWRHSLQWGDGPGELHGFQVGSDYGGDQKAANSVKNTFGKIAQRYPATPSGLRQLVQDPDFKRAFPNARLVEHPTGDKIDFGGVLSDFESGTPVGIVDVGLSFDGANDTGRGWWWGPDGGSAPAPANASPSSAPPPVTPPPSTTGNPSMNPYAYENLADQNWSRYGSDTMDDVLRTTVL